VSLISPCPRPAVQNFAAELRHRDRSTGTTTTPAKVREHVCPRLFEGTAASCGQRLNLAAVLDDTPPAPAQIHLFANTLYSGGSSRYQRGLCRCWFLLPVESKFTYRPSKWRGGGHTGPGGVLRENRRAHGETIRLRPGRLRIQDKMIWSSPFRARSGGPLFDGACGFSAGAKSLASQLVQQVLRFGNPGANQQPSVQTFADLSPISPLFFFLGPRAVKLCVTDLARTIEQRQHVARKNSSCVSACSQSRRLAR